MPTLPPPPPPAGRRAGKLSSLASSTSWCPGTCGFGFDGRFREEVLLYKIKEVQESACILNPAPRRMGFRMMTTMMVVWLERQQKPTEGSHCTRSGTVFRVWLQVGWRGGSNPPIVGQPEGRPFQGAARPNTPPFPSGPQPPGPSHRRRPTPACGHCGRV